MDKNFLITYDESSVYRFFSEDSIAYHLKLSAFGEKDLDIATEETQIFIDEDTINSISLAYLNIDKLNFVMLQKISDGSEEPSEYVIYTDYTFDSDSQVMTFNSPLEPGDTLLINYTTLDNFYIRQITDTFLQTVVLDIETEGRDVIEIEDIDVLECSEDSFVISDDEAVPSSFDVKGGRVKIYLMGEVPEAIRVQLIYYTAIPLIENESYELTVEYVEDGQEKTFTENWTCLNQNGILYLGNYDYFMGDEEPGEPEEETIVIDSSHKKNITEIIDTVINYAEGRSQYKITFDNDEYILYSKLLADVEEETDTAAYVGNLSLYTNVESDDTGEPFFVLTIQHELSEEEVDRPYYETWLYANEGEHTLLIEDYNLIILPELAGAALVSFGRKVEEDEVIKLEDNYGIGINSSDIDLTLPARAISLFETGLNTPTLEDKSKIKFNYRGILGTLPENHIEGLPNNDLYTRHMRGTQGIYTDNMYIGDNSQFVAFYTDADDKQKHLKISARDIIYEIKEDGEETSWDDHIDEQIDGGLDNRLKYFWQNLEPTSEYPAGTYMAGGIENIIFDKTKVKTYGYNTFMDNTSLKFRYNDEVLTEIGETITLGNKQDLHLEIKKDKIAFVSGEIDGEPGKEVSYINSEKLYIPYSVVLNEMEIGEVEGQPLWAWQVNEDQHLRLVWLGNISEED